MVSGKMNNRKVVLGHTRLSIIELSRAGSQPMISSSGRYLLLLMEKSIIIYNYVKGN